MSTVIQGLRNRSATSSEQHDARDCRQSIRTNLPVLEPAKMTTTSDFEMISARIKGGAPMSAINSIFLKLILPEPLVGCAHIN